MQCISYVSWLQVETQTNSHTQKACDTHKKTYDEASNSTFNRKDHLNVEILAMVLFGTPIFYLSFCQIRIAFLAGNSLQLESIRYDNSL